MRRLDDATLATYLNDHLAGSVAALQLMGRICDAHGDGPVGLLVARLRADVEYEQTQLRTLLHSLDASENHVSQAVAWVGEQFTRLKFGASRRDEAGLKLFEALEALSMGFFGRMALWRILLVVRDELRVAIDFEALAMRASRHLADLEQARIAAGLAALCATTDGHAVAQCHDDSRTTLAL